jgi:sulfate adenylyltransferase subunit 1
MDDAPLNNGTNYFVKLGTSLIPGIVTKILYTIDVNTGKFRETDVVQKNEIAVCRLSLTDRISIARFKDHKTLGELILIDRVSFATSACGVVEQYEKNGGLIGDNVTKDTRSSVLGQKAVTILFKSSEGFSRTLLEKVEKKLILGGRHTYLLEADESVKENELPAIIRHLNEAGIVVLLLVHNDSQVQVLLDSKSEITGYEKDQKQEEDIVSFVRKVSSYDYVFVKDSSFI